MSGDTDNSGQGDVRDRIVSLMRTMGQARTKVFSQEEGQTLRAAANRLDQLLKEFADAEEARRKEARNKEIQTLRVAAGRLDRFLTGITGKQALPELKLRRPKKDKTE
jgi:hypothetical protein